MHFYNITKFYFANKRKALSSASRAKCMTININLPVLLRPLHLEADWAHNNCDLLMTNLGSF